MKRRLTLSELRERRRHYVEKFDELLKLREASTTTQTEPDHAVTIRIGVGPDHFRQCADLRNRIAALDRYIAAARKRAHRAAEPRTESPPAPPQGKDVVGELLTEAMLAIRWSCSRSRLQRWRSDGRGPRYLKIVGKVLYRIEDVRKYENNCVVEPVRGRPAVRD